jgi:SAM-dependent methyltransferase
MSSGATAPDSKERFSNRVENYLRYRPGYPAAVLDLLRVECSLTPESVVADVGSGTGLLSRMFLESGHVVYGVEPNESMRQAGDEYLKNYPRFRSVLAPAETTTLAGMSVDLVVAAQAFHWFQPNEARSEFTRILKPRGWVAVIWNERRKDATPFLHAYEKFLRAYGTDYEKVAETYPDDRNMADFFGAGAWRHKSFENAQVFDFDGLRGRLLSSSYSPPEDHPNHEPMLAALKQIFDAHQKDGSVRFEYATHVYYGRLK